ncbi:hypothetical protein HAX54_030824 [Datura stramonium]|uniref:Uncharacterized protein n=1 Tax=Datura stramonium TaxID=4076 RepID=A0ABS8VB02_DATST|nr:hypothetical protein [Datura stramonium]
MIEIKYVKKTLGAMAGDLHMSNELLNVLISSVAELKTQLTLLQHEGVKSFNKVHCQVDSTAARAEVYDSELAVVVQNSYSSLSTRIKSPIIPFSSVLSIHSSLANVGYNQLTQILHKGENQGTYMMLMGGRLTPKGRNLIKIQCCFSMNIPVGYKGRIWKKSTPKSIILNH